MDQEVDVWKPDAVQLFRAVKPTTPRPAVVAFLLLPTSLSLPDFPWDLLSCDMGQNKGAEWALKFENRVHIHTWACVLTYARVLLGINSPRQWAPQG